MHEESISKERDDWATYKIFTDGLGYDGKAGASVVLHNRDDPQEYKTLKYHLGKLSEHMTYKAEMVRALLAMWLFKFIPNPLQHSISIYTDSQAMVRSPSKQASGSGWYLVDAFCLEADRFSGQLTLNWVSGHSKVKGNERADKLAKQAAQGQSNNIL